MPYTFDSMHGPGVSGVSAPTMSIQNIGRSDNITPSMRNFASDVSEHASFDASELGDAIREGLSNYASSAQKAMGSFTDVLSNYLNQANDYALKSSELSQQYAREQMAYQMKSDRDAMAWSAQEASKNREWQERLSNTAHQREVADLIKAGLNPILSANNGASTGSGATGQAFASHGAMGNVNEAMPNVVGSLISSVINSGSQAALTNMNNQMTKYQADMQYASAKLAAEASIYNNNNTVSANKAINRMNNERLIEQANINASASRYVSDQSLRGALANAGAMTYSADQAHANAILNKEAMQYSADQALQGHYVDQETQKWLNEHNINSNPAGYVVGQMNDAINMIQNTPYSNSNEPLVKNVIDAMSMPSDYYDNYETKKRNEEGKKYYKYLNENIPFAN